MEEVNKKIEQLESQLRIAMAALAVAVTRKACRNNYECCGTCGPIYEAEEALEEIAKLESK